MVVLNKMRIPLMLALTVGFGLSLMGAPALAQLAPQPLPAQNNPGVLTPSPSEPDFSRNQRREEKYLPGKEQVEDQKFEVKPTGRSQMQGGDQKFVIKHINIEGMTLFPPERMRFITAGYVNREVTLDELSDMADAITNYYREAGYLTSQAYVPPQEVHDGGDLTIRVVEGTVGEMSFQGNHYYRTATIARQFQERPGKPLNIKTLEQDLHRANRFYDYQARASLSPGADTGQTNIKMEVKEAQPWQLTPTFDNQGRPFIGYYRGGAEVYNGSLTGHADRAYVRYFGASGTQSVLGSYFMPVSKHNDEIGLNYSYTHVNVDLNVPNPPDITGNANSAGLSWVHPFDPDRIWVGDVGVNYRRVNNLFLGNSTQLDEIRTVHAALNFDKFDRYGRTFFRTQATEGVTLLGGNWPFFKMEGFLTRLFTLPNNNVFLIRSYGQYSPNDLPTAEAYQLGGAYSVRGYTEGLFIADRGYSVTFEDRMPIPFLGRISPWLDDRLQLAVFYDIGQAWLDRSNTRFIPGISNRGQNTLLMGTGFGLRARLNQYMQGFVDLGFGLLNRHAEEPLSQPTARVHFGIRSELLPKRYISRSNTVQYMDSSGRIYNAPPGQKTASVQPPLDELKATEIRPEATTASVAPMTPPPTPEMDSESEVTGNIVTPEPPEKTVEAPKPPAPVEVEEFQESTDVTGNIVSQEQDLDNGDEGSVVSTSPSEIPLPQSEAEVKSNGMVGLNFMLQAHPSDKP